MNNDIKDFEGYKEMISYWHFQMRLTFCFKYELYQVVNLIPMLDATFNLSDNSFVQCLPTDLNFVLIIHFLQQRKVIIIARNFFPIYI